jgi:hypothetical protein
MQINSIHHIVDTVIHQLIEDTRPDKNRAGSAGRSQVIGKYAVVLRRASENDSGGRAIIGRIQEALKAGRLDTPQAIRLAALCLLRYGI